jgi:hypothetical protein
MPKTFNDYMTAEIDGDFVVFLTGMRLNRPWKIWKWLPLFIAMPRMNRELAANPDLGMLHYRYHAGIRSMMVVQYWSSFEKLHAYAKAKDRAHLPAWKWMNKAVGLNGDIGTWHETYMVKKSQYECLYVNMPQWGLANAGRHISSRGARRTAKGRLGQKNDDWTEMEIPTALGDVEQPAVEQPIPARQQAAE